MTRAASLLGWALTALALASPALAEVPVPALTGRVVDQAGILSAEQRRAIAGKLESFERAKGSQVAVLVVPTTGGEAIEDFATRVTDSWKLGRSGVDDGVLLLVAMQERQVRIQTGRGVQGTLTDALSKRIIVEQVTPRFREGNFAGGIEAGTGAILAAVAGEELPPPRPARQSQAVGSGSVADNLVFVAFFVVPFLAIVLRNALGRFVGAGATGLVAGGAAAFVAGSVVVGVLAAVLAFFFTFAVDSSRGARWNSGRGVGGWGGGGGFGGGGFGGGGFGGGGGGFDGGGASGRW